MRFRTRPRRSVLVDITPLVDVVFMLVIFFTVTTTFASHTGLRVDLPSAEQVESEVNDDPLEVVITETGSLFLNQEEVPRNKLKDKLDLLKEGKGSPVLVIKADRNTRHGDVVHVMDQAREAGLGRLAIAADKERGKEE